MLALQVSHEPATRAALHHLVHNNLSNPDHKQHGRYLARSELRPYFAPATESLRRVNQWLGDELGSNVDVQVSPFGDILFVGASVGQLQGLLGRPVCVEKRPSRPSGGSGDHLDYHMTFQLAPPAQQPRSVKFNLPEALDALLHDQHVTILGVQGAATLADCTAPDAEPPVHAAADAQSTGPSPEDFGAQPWYPVYPPPMFRFTGQAMPATVDAPPSPIPQAGQPIPFEFIVFVQCPDPAAAPFPRTQLPLTAQQALTVQNLLNFEVGRTHTTICLSNVD